MARSYGTVHGIRMTRLAPGASTGVEQAAARLTAASAELAPCAPVRDVIAPGDVATAYAVQQRLADARIAAGAKIVGRKIGLTSPAVQAQLGVDQPDFGILFDDMAFATGADIPAGRLIQPKVEAEVAFVLRSDLVDGPLDVEQVRGAVDYAVAALEIVDSRIANWDITFVDTVADNGSSALFVLGSERRDLTDFEPIDVEMTMTADGETVSTGNGAACLGDPLLALAWLAATSRDFGHPLRAGDVVLSGALGPMFALCPGVKIEAELTGLGIVSMRFTANPQ